MMSPPLEWGFLIIWIPAFAGMTWFFTNGKSGMSRNQKPLRRVHEGHMKLIALLMYVAEQKQKSLDTVEQLFRRLMPPRKD
jgi:hypothetical protein